MRRPPPAEDLAIFKSGVLDSFPSPSLVISREGVIVSANKPAADILVMSVKRLHGSRCSAIIEEPLRNEFSQHVSKCFRTGRETSFETKIIDGESNTFAAEVFISRFRESLLRKHLCLVVLTDMSGVKEKELDLLRFSNVAHFTVNPLEITDVHGRIIYVNPAFEKASGYARSELVGKNPNIFGSGKHPTGFWKKMWDTINAGKVWVGEIENRKKNGEPFFTHLLISPIVDAKEKIVGYFGIHRDITRQRNLEQQLIHAQKMESIGLLAAGIAHEVGNPLTSISSLVQVIQRTTVDEFTHEKLELIKSQVGRISRTIRDLVDFSRRSNYEIQPTDLNKSAREGVEIVRVGRKAKEIEFRVELDEHAPPLPLVPDQMQQVFINILINAVDAIHTKWKSDPQTPTPGHGEIVVKTAVVEDVLRITIGDNGIGIPEEALPKIFEPFYTTKKVGEGTGLGLWVSYGIIKSFRGNISVDSRPGQGTTFTIVIPIQSEFS